MTVLFDQGIFSVEGLSGEVLPGAKLYFYASGSSTPQATYADDGLTTPNTNPVVAAADGRFPAIWLSPLAYKIVLKSFDDVTLVTRDPVNGANTPSDGAVSADSLTDDADQLASMTDKLFPHQKHWIIRYGGTAGGSFDNAAAATAMADAVGDDSVSLDTPGRGFIDYADQGYVPAGAFKLDSNVTLPPSLWMNGRFTGAGKIITPAGQQRRYWGLGADGGIVVSGQYTSQIDGAFGPITIDAGAGGSGTFWTWIKHYNGNVEFDVSKGPVNFNVLGPGHGDILFKGNHVPGNADFHANLLFMVDASYGDGIRNTSDSGDTNWILGGYYENGSDISGPFHTVFFHGDSGHPPLVTKRHHLLCSTDHTDRNSADFIAAAATSLVPGWSSIDGNGKPASLSAISGSPTVSNQFDEPGMCGKKWSATFTGTNSGFSIAVPAVPGGKLAAVIYFFSQADSQFEAVQVDNGTNSGVGTFCEPDAVQIRGTHWWMLRICAPARSDGTNNINLFVNGGTAATKTIGIGSYFVTQEKAALLPLETAVPARRVNNAIGVYGRYTVQANVDQGYVNAPPSVDVTVPFGVTFATPPSSVQAGLVATHAQTSNFTKLLVKDGSITTTECVVTVTYATEWRGRVVVTASGALA